ncbi:MAG TPA: OmpH family outer membrane protein [Bacteroidota bacterium]|nr:OmpH family outer membrane protein [Bacteroidota bacterium]
MKSILHHFSIVFIVGTLSFITFLNAQTLKVGFVNSAKILLEYPEAQEAQKKIDALGKQWQSELEKMSRELEQKYEEYKKKEALLNEQEKRNQREELIALEQKGIQYRQIKFGNDGELAILTDSLLSPIKKKVMKIIEQVAKEEKLQFIFDRNDQFLVLLYGDIKYDYTNFIIDRLKRGK